MFEGFFKFFKELDRRVKVVIVGAGIHNWSQSLPLQYDQLYATDLGANPIELGSLNSINAAFTSIISVPMGWAADRYSMKNVMLLGLAASAIISGIYALASNWWMLIPAIILGGMVRILALADIIFVNYTKTEQRGMVMALSRMVLAIPRIFIPLIAGVLVAGFGGINAQGIRPLYYIQIVLFSLAFLFMILKFQTPAVPIHEKEESTSKSTSFIRNIQDFFKDEKWLKRWVFLRSVKQFGMSISTPFIPLWMAKVKGADPYILGMIGTIGVISSLLLQVPVGKLADRIGRKKAFYFLDSFTFLGTLLLIAAPNPHYLILAGLLGIGGSAIGGGIGGGIGGVSFVPYITMYWESVPEEKRGRLFGIDGILSASRIPATLLGGILWQKGFMIGVLLIPILLEVLVAIPILITLPDVLVQKSR